MKNSKCRNIEKVLKNKIIQKWKVLRNLGKLNNKDIHRIDECLETKIIVHAWGKSWKVEKIVLKWKKYLKHEIKNEK